MLLIPPEEADAAQAPKYSISMSLSLNPFLPISYTTRIRRAGNALTVEDEFVGEFE